MTRYRVPLATYRIQFNADFTFQHATDIAAYLSDLGISDVYASPILRARPGSMHGYDVVDATALNPELGTEEDFDALHHELHSRGMGLLLDIVPNHMAASPENAWWMSVLENGPSSRFLHYFDIDWTPVASRAGTTTKVLLPILGKPYGEAVESQEITLGFDASGFFVSYYDRRLPIAPESYRQILRECVDALPHEGIAIELRELIDGPAATDAEDSGIPNSRFLKETLWRIYEQSEEFRNALDRTIAAINGQTGQPDSFNKLDALLELQHYRLAYWRIASERINYRRFFDVTDLVGVKVENPEVFEARNRRTLELIAEGKVTGLRIDHIDGLYDPLGHMRKLQLRLGEPGGPQLTSREATGSEADREGVAASAGTASTQMDDDALPAHTPPRDDLAFYVVVEKILAEGEELPPEFPVSGTTGYDSLNSLNDVFVDSDGLQSLTSFYRELTGDDLSFEELCYRRKKQVIAELFSGEMRALGTQLGAVAALDRNARDFAPSELLSALTEITASMHVYRTYTRAFEVSAADRAFIGEAVRNGRKRAADADPRVFDFLERVLLVDVPSYAEQDRDRWLGFVMRWQQFTGRVMAKGVEDTAFYNYNRLISLNEVGGEPGRAPNLDGLARFHARNAALRERWRDNLNASSTHDTKRSEDVRARINVLSEIAPEWQETVTRWSKIAAPLHAGNVPDPNVELLIFQTLVGMWPLDESERPGVPDRLRAYLEKASREAKTHTSWIAPDEQYEKALLEFATSLVEQKEFLADFEPFRKRVAFHGFLNALSQLLLKAASPGVPDFYQGTELWDFSLVDPDNRRPVDYELRRKQLDELQANGDPAALLESWRDGRVKLFATWKVLAARRENEALFREGDYVPLATEGTTSICAFARSHDDQAAVVVVPRFTTRLVQEGTLPLGEVWQDATLSMPADGAWRNAFTGETITAREGRIALRDVLASFPIALLLRG
jgi:(1->4)-alpha-D-glucan 1-alpha-D-glucosylmutase